MIRLAQTSYGGPGACMYTYTHTNSWVHDIITCTYVHMYMCVRVHLQTSIVTRLKVCAHMYGHMDWMGAV